MLTEQEKAINEVIRLLNKWTDLNGDEGATEEDLHQLHDNLSIVKQDVADTLKRREQDRVAK